MGSISTGPRGADYQPIKLVQDLVSDAKDYDSRSVITKNGN